MGKIISEKELTDKINESTGGDYNRDKEIVEIKTSGLELLLERMRNAPIREARIRELKGFLKKTPKSVKHMLVYLDTLLEYIDLLFGDYYDGWECITLGHLNMLSYIANNAYGKKYFIDVFEIENKNHSGISYERVIEYIKSIKKHIEDWEEKE